MQEVVGRTSDGQVVVYRTAVPVTALLYSRKFWLAVVGVVQAVILHTVNVDPEVWQSVMVLVGVLIGAIAYEDAAYLGRKAGEVVIVDVAETIDAIENTP